MNNASPMPDDRIAVDSREAARLLGISERSLYTLTKAGRIPCFRLGRSVRYYVATLRTLTDTGNTSPASSGCDGGFSPLPHRQ